MRYEIIVLLAPILVSLRLRIDNDIGEEEIVLAGEREVIRQRFGTVDTVPAEHVDAHDLTNQRRCEMVG